MLFFKWLDVGWLAIARGIEQRQQSVMQANRSLATAHWEMLNRYLVSMHGQGLRVPRDNYQLAGFYTSRRVLARSKTGAIARAKELVEREWLESPYSELDTHRQLSLEVEYTDRLSLLSLLWRPGAGRGFTFYSEDE